MRQGSSLRERATFETPLLLFLLSALIGAVISYDNQAAWGRFWWIAGGLALSVGLAYLPERLAIRGRIELCPPSLVLGLLPTAMAMYFLLTNDWSYRMGKVTWLDPALRFLALWQPGLHGHGLDSNVVGGVIAAFLPLQMVALLGLGREGRTGAAARLALLSVSGLGLLLSESRGAWLALAAVAGASWLWTLAGSIPLFTNRWAERGHGRLIAALGLIVVGVVLVAALASTPLGERLLGLRPDRLAVWHNSLNLARDYAFTGLGLSGFEMAYSSYVLLIHVPYLYHAHNLFLDIHLQQGLLGLLVFLLWVVAAAWPKSPVSRLGWAARASLAVILLHGLLDDAFYGYGGQATLLLFLPLAVLARNSESAIEQVPRRRFAMSKPVIALTIPVAAALLTLAVWLSPGIRAGLQANLGALSQTRAELSVYRWPEWSLQDQVRRSSQVDLTAAIGWYQAALASDPTNATAHRRLGQIELSLGQYDVAQRHLMAAYAAAPDQRATRQMLGESYALAGEVEQAILLWRTVDLTVGQLQLRSWWYGEYLRDRERASRLAGAAAGVQR